MTQEKLTQCQHQFYTIKQTRRAVNPSPLGTSSTSPNIVCERWDDEYGVMVGCALCGQIKTIWENGDIEIKEINGETGDAKN